MDISHLDHLVLTVSDIENTVQFYQQVLGMKKTVFSDKRVALSFGMQKINLHQAGREFEPKAATPGPGSADLCFITTTSLAKAMAHVQQCGIEIIEGPVERTGARNRLRSFYIRDPDGNLIEIANEI